MKERTMEALKDTFRPELLNRIDEIIVFHALEREDTRRITDLMVAQVVKRLKDRDIHITVSTEAMDLLAEKGFDPQYGARPLRRAIQRMMEDTLSEEILSGNIDFGDEVTALAEDGRLVFRNETRLAAQPLDVEVIEDEPADEEL